MDTQLSHPGLLDGITIVSMAEQYPGPYCTLLLADMGADVILIERPGGGDPARQFPSFFAALNRNKRSVALDLKDAEGREAASKLVERADVFLEGFRPGTLKRLGLGYEDLSARNPALIYCSISGFGQTGPYRDRPGHDVTYEGMAGMLSHGWGAVPDPIPGLAIGDLSSGMFAALSIVAALFARTRFGRGTYIDVSMTDGLVSWMTTELVPLLNGRRREALIRDPAYGVFKTSDARYLTISIAHEDHFWQRLCDVLSWDDVRTLGRRERVGQSEKLSTRLSQAILSRPRDEWIDLFAAAEIPAGPVLALEEVADDLGIAQRGLITAWSSEDGSLTRYVAQPVKFSGYRTGIRRDVPRLGEHNDEVLGKEGVKTPNGLTK